MPLNDMRRRERKKAQINLNNPPLNDMRKRERKKRKAVQFKKTFGLSLIKIDPCLMNSSRECMNLIQYQLGIIAWSYFNMI